MDYKADFKFDPDDQSYKLFGPSQDRVTADLLLAFNRDVEGKIRQALIDMGWTPPATCVHTWTDARNSIVKSGYICLKCGAIRAGNENS